MDYDIIQKIDLVVTKINLRKNDLEHNLKLSTENLRRLQKKNNTNERSYRYNLEKINMTIIVIKASINKCNLYIKRCIAYQEYLKCLEKKDPILLENAKFNFIKAFQEETIHDLNSKIEKNSQMRMIKNIIGSKSNDLEDKSELINKRKDIFKRFLETDFVIDKNRTDSTYYLNYNTEELVDSLYPKNDKNKKVS